MRTDRALTSILGGSAFLRGGGLCLSSWGSGLPGGQTPPPLAGRPPCEQKDACDNITFTRFTKRAVINLNMPVSTCPRTEPEPFSETARSGCKMSDKTGNITPPLPPKLLWQGGIRMLILILFRHDRPTQETEVGTIILHTQHRHCDANETIFIQTLAKV